MAGWFPIRTNALDGGRIFQRESWLDSLDMRLVGGQSKSRVTIEIMVGRCTTPSIIAKPVKHAV